MEPERLKLVLYWSGLTVFLLLELRRSYRLPTVSRKTRWFTNLPLSIINGLLYHFAYFSLLTGLFVQVEKQRLGLLNSHPLPGWLEIVLGVVILDLFIYLWHLLNHVVPLLWRFHRVHHSDLNMDASTANRFHAGEILLSGLVRLGVVYTFGIPFAAYILFEILLNLSIQFHHSSIRVNSTFEEYWLRLFIPPSMHRIHHSVKIRERDSNYGSLLSLWDRIFGTLVWGIDQSKIVIGLGSHRDFDKLGFGRLWLMPFTAGSR